MSYPGPFSDQSEPELSGGLVDPRIIRPSPEGILSDDTELPETDVNQTTPGEETAPEEDVRGIVDPRSETAGPDL